MGIARSTYYDRPARTVDDTALVEAIAATCDEFEAYGWRRVQAALRQQGIVANHKKIRRLMREHGLQPKHRRRFVATTDSDHDGPIFPNLARDMAPLDGPNQLWVADITYVAVTGGFVYVAVYVAVILDAWSRVVVGYAKSRWVYRKLRNFRAGIEAGISCLKRAYGLARSTWRGLAHFKAYVWSSVVAYNLTLLARLRPS